MSKHVKSVQFRLGNTASVPGAPLYAAMASGVMVDVFYEDSPAASCTVKAFQSFEAIPDTATYLSTVNGSNIYVL